MPYNTEVENELLLAFNDYTMDNNTFCHLLESTDKQSPSFVKLRKAIKRLTVY